MPERSDRHFVGCVAFVTGGGNGIGRAAAIAFASAGAAVAVVDIAEDAMAETVAQIEAAGGRAIALRCDVTKGDQVEAAVAETVNTLGGLDFAFNNAGIEQPGMALADIPEDMFDRLMTINVRGVYLCMKHQIPVMLAKGRGSIVNTSSTAGKIAFRNQAAYSASKFGVVALSQSAALEYATQGIRVNALCPGITDTPMITRAWGTEKATLERLMKQEPVGRFAQPDEIAAAALWLCSDQASFVTGHAMSVDGGQSAGI